MLSHNTGLTHLSLARNTIDTEGGVALASSLGANRCLEKLDLCHNCMGAGVGAAFGRAVAQSSVASTHLKLRALYLDCNSLMDAGVCGLVAALVDGRKGGVRALEELHVTKNSFGPEGERALQRLRRAKVSKILDYRPRSMLGDAHGY